MVRIMRKFEQVPYCFKLVLNWLDIILNWLELILNYI